MKTALSLPVKTRVVPVAATVLSLIFYSVAIAATPSCFDALEEHIAAAELTLSIVPMSVMIIDLDEKILWVNENFTQMTGYSSHDVFKQSSAEIHEGISLSHKKDGSVYSRKTKIVSVSDKDGSPMYRVVFTENITQLHENESNVAAQTQQIGELTNELKNLQRDQRLELLGRMLIGTVHDFNTLLTVINAMSELILLDMNADDPHHEMVGLIRKTGTNAAKLVQRLLAFSRNNAIKTETLNVYDEFIGMQPLLETVATTQIKVTIDNRASDPRMNVDKGQLSQMIVNLVANARDAILSDPNISGTISITIKQRNILSNYIYDGGIIPIGEYLIIQVFDNGPGINQANIKKIFEPFFTTKNGDATGLGLANVACLTRKTHGHIFVESEVGTGTTFSMFFPTVKP